MAMEAVFYLLSVLCLISGTHIYELKCWDGYANVRYNGQNLVHSDINDDMECINKCREYDSCEVVNMDTSTKGNCWYQVNSSDMVTVNDLVETQTSTSYLYDRTCREITRGVDLNCWDVTANAYLPKSNQIDRKTLADCLRECRITKNCWSVNWVVNTTPSCHILTGHLDEDIRIIKSSQSTNFIYSLKCLAINAGVDLRFWRVAAKTKYPSPELLQVNKMDVQSCLNYCLSNENCTMVDFDQSTNPPCWAQTTKFPILRGQLVDNDNRYNYLLLRKEYEAYRAAVRGKGCWKVNGSNPTGLTNDEKRKLIRCRRTCLHRSDCDTVSWHTDSSRCYVWSWPLLQPFFILDRECYKSVVGSVLSYRPGVDTTCWIETLRHQINGLTGVDKQSVSECLEECLINEDCRAVNWDESWDSDTMCFIQTNKNLQVSSTQLVVMSDATNYILDRECFAALFMI